MFFQNSAAFERAALGSSSTGIALKNKFKGHNVIFDKEVRRIIEETDCDVPDTRIGKSIYGLAKSWLERESVDTKGFKLCSAINTAADAKLKIDCFFYHPAVPRTPVTIDLFNCPSTICELLRNRWMKQSGSVLYTAEQFQNDMFLYKEGMWAWKEEQVKNGHFFPNYYIIVENSGEHRVKIESLPEWVVLISTGLDFRTLAKRARWANHFILTPMHVQNSARRKAFAHMIARYLAGKIPRRGRKNSP